MLKNALAPTAPNRSFSDGQASDVALVGDWNGDGDDTLALRRGSTFYVKDTLGGGSADQVFNYGQVDDLALAGDWDGDGDDTVGVRRYDHNYYLKNSLGSGSADLSFVYSARTDILLYGHYHDRRRRERGRLRHRRGPDLTRRADDGDQTGVCWWMARRHWPSTRT